MKIKSWYSAFLLTGLLLTLFANCKKEVTVEEKIPVPPSNGEVYDRDGNKYATVVIGTQEWFSSNLKTTTFNDGTSIPLVTDKTAWSKLVTPGYCWNNNDATTYKIPYGALYNWYTVNTGKLCPKGWRVPSDADWSKLRDYLGGDLVASGKLKEAGTSHWNETGASNWEGPNIGATNVTGFTALPGGLRYPYGTFYSTGIKDGTFIYVGVVGYWWSSSESYAATLAWNCHMWSGNNRLYIENIFNKQYGQSVRCLKDQY